VIAIVFFVVILVVGALATLLMRRPLARVASANSPFWIALPPPVIAAFVVRPLAARSVDADYWWHLAAGRWMLDHLRVPVSDPFSFTHAGQSWYAHEWLAEVVLALADKAGGYAGGIVLTAVIAAAGLWLSWRTARLYGASSARPATVLTVAAALFMVKFTAVRPQVWGFTLFALLLHELAAHDTGRRRRLWLLPFVFVLFSPVREIRTMPTGPEDGPPGDVLRDGTDGGLVIIAPGESPGGGTRAD